MAYKPKPIEGELFVDNNGNKYKVESLTNDGVNVLKFKADGTGDKTIFWPESKWNAKGLKGITDTPPLGDSEKFIFSIDEKGVLSIAQDGKLIQELGYKRT